MKRTLLAVSLLALLQWSKCYESGENSSFGAGHELIQSQLNAVQLKLGELLDKFGVMLKHQITTNNRLSDLTASLDSNTSSQIPLNDPIPTGCVLIRSIYSDKYLAVSTKYDSQQRQLSQQNHPEQWILVRDGGHYYRITRQQGKEDLYAAYMYYNEDRRRIFTWIPGAGESQGRWEIEKAAGFPGKVYIRSWYFAEYLYAASSKNAVYTWIPKGDPDEDRQYLWEIEQC